eukprot:m.130082 g.130082  ORF g.130082 m.130082 type:complete len:497 (-) comp11278_c3_seq1:46-1536(-)
MRGLWKKKTKLTNVDDPDEIYVFNSVTEAAIFLGVGPSKLSTARSTGRPFHGFYATDATEHDPPPSNPSPLAAKRGRMRGKGKRRAPMPALAKEAKQEMDAVVDPTPVPLQHVPNANAPSAHIRARAVTLTNTLDPMDRHTYSTHGLAAMALEVTDRLVAVHRHKAIPLKGWYITYAGEVPAAFAGLAGSSTDQYAKSDTTVNLDGSSVQSSPVKDSGSAAASNNAGTSVSESTESRAHKKLKLQEEPAEPDTPSNFQVYGDMATRATNGKWPVTKPIQTTESATASLGVGTVLTGVLGDAKFEHDFAGGRELGAVLAGHSAALIAAESQLEEQDLHALPPSLPGHSGRLYSGPSNRRGRNRDFLVVKRPNEVAKSRMHPDSPVPPLRELDAGTWYDVTAMEKENYLSLDLDSEDGFWYVTKILGLIDASSAGATEEGFQYLAYIMWPAFPEFDPVWVPYRKENIVQWAALESEGFILEQPEPFTPKNAYAYKKKE